jgi:hypothetical protein
LICWGFILPPSTTVDAVDGGTIATEHIPIQPLLAQDVLECNTIWPFKLFKPGRLLDTSSLGIMQKVNHLKLLQWMNAGYRCTDELHGKENASEN